MKKTKSIKIYTLAEREKLWQKEVSKVIDLSNFTIKVNNKIISQPKHPK